jgi:UDP-3-O-[3-hydroxymyristoyl] N-acetylglucosamine deacetylase
MTARGSGGSDEGKPAATAPIRAVERPARWEGVGVHTGERGVVKVLPSDEFGIVFLVNGTEIPATADHVVDTSRCTTLGKDGATIMTVEHLLAALTGLGIWSARIEVEGPEIPILDGSAAVFVERLKEAGIRRIGETKRLAPREIHLEEGNAQRSCRPSEDATEMAFEIRGDHPMLAGQTAAIRADDAEAFAEEIAPCRTWAPIEQIQPLLDRNLIRGGSLDNAVVVYTDHYSSPLRRESEPARHKLLDLIGDLALAGAPLQARIDAAGGGHALNYRLARSLRAEGDRGDE